MLTLRETAALLEILQAASTLEAAALAFQRAFVRAEHFRVAAAVSILIEDGLLPVQQPVLLPAVHNAPPESLPLYSSPVFITPDVLLGRKTKQVLKPTATLADAQLIDDDIVYVATD